MIMMRSSDSDNTAISHQNTGMAPSGFDHSLFQDMVLSRIVRKIVLLGMSLIKDLSSVESPGFAYECTFGDFLSRQILQQADNDLGTPLENDADL